MEPKVHTGIVIRSIHLAPRVEAIRIYYCGFCVCWYNQWQRCAHAHPTPQVGVA